MRIRYVLPFKDKVRFLDHWEVPILGGTCRIIEEDGLAKSVELVFSGLPTSLAPTFTPIQDGEVKGCIAGHDVNMPLVKQVLDDAVSFLRCYFEFDISFGTVTSHYEPESPEEKKHIGLSMFGMDEVEPVSSVPFDMFSRAIMAAERGSAPRFEAALINTARDALFQHRFIDSFRYAFLLIESLHGAGQFKTAGLKEILKADHEFKKAVAAALVDPIRPRSSPRASETTTLIAGNPTVEAVIDHLVDQRGFYFHGNVHRRNAWKPDEQGIAESLALLAFNVASKLAQAAATPLFAKDLEKKHFDNAKKAGAIIVYQISFKYQVADEKFRRDGQVNITMPGTKVTQDAPTEVAYRFLELFRNQTPMAALLDARCEVKGLGTPIFELRLHAVESAKQSDPPNGP